MACCSKILPQLHFFILTPSFWNVAGCSIWTYLWVWVSGPDGVWPEGGVTGGFGSGVPVGFGVPVAPGVKVAGGWAGVPVGSGLGVPVAPGVNVAGGWVGVPVGSGLGVPPGVGVAEGFGVSVGPGVGVMEGVGSSGSSGFVSPLEEFQKMICFSAITLSFNAFTSATVSKLP